MEISVQDKESALQKALLELRDREEKLQASEESISSLSAELSHAKSNLASREDASKLLTEQLQSATHDLAASKSSEATLEAQIKTCSVDSSQLKDEIKVLKADKSSLEDKVQSLEKDLQSVGTEYEAKSCTMKQLTEDFNQNGRALAECKLRSEDLEHQLKILKEELDCVANNRPFKQGHPKQTSLSESQCKDMAVIKTEDGISLLQSKLAEAQVGSLLQEFHHLNHSRVEWKGQFSHQAGEHCIE